LTPYAGLANRCLQPLGHLSQERRNLTRGGGGVNCCRQGVWFTIRWAYGVPAHMIHDPVFLGVVANPVVFAS